MNPTHQDEPAPALPARLPRIGLALGGGGARGLAHILVLEAFDELGITPCEIAGTSIGAIFGSGYASGLTARQIRAHTEELLSRRMDMLRQLFAARNEPLQRVLSVFQLRSALLNPEALLDLVLPKRTAATFEDLAIPLKVIAADYYTQEQIVFHTGPLKPAVAASMALPALFAPVRTEDGPNGPMALMDGGLVNPLPFDCLGPDVEISVAINVSGAGRLSADRKPPRVIEAIVASSQILQNTLVREKLKTRQPDVLIDVEVGHFHVLEFHKLDAVLEAAAPAKAELKRKLSRILSAETLPVLEAPERAAPASAADDEAEGQAARPPRRRRLADRLLRSD